MTSQKDRTMPESDGTELLTGLVLNRCSCGDGGWVDDENWEPEHEGERSRGRVEGSGRVPCGFCNPGGWDKPDDGKPRKPGYVYVASSWRCAMQTTVVAALRSAGIDHYDFKNPPNGAGFGWEQVGGKSPFCRCDHTRGPHGFCAAHGEAPFSATTGCSCPKDSRQSIQTYLEMIQHPRAIEGYAADFDAMTRADTFVLVLPCNRSAHLELGWAVGQGKRTAVLLEDPMEPELMYRMVDYVAPSLFDLLGWLGVED